MRGASVNTITQHQKTIGGTPKRVNKYNAVKKQGKRSNLEIDCDTALRKNNITFDYEP